MMTKVEIGSVARYIQTGLYNEYSQSEALMALDRREHLVQTALDLFCRDGFHATGIDRILTESGVAKMTLYKHFRSKDDLILAVLRRRDEEFRNWFVRAVERSADTPRARLLALFDVLGVWFAEKTFSGCTFINAAAEYGHADDPIHASAAEHKCMVRSYIRDLAQAAGARDPDDLANALNILIEGAITMAYVVGERDAAARARGSAETLIAAAIP